MNDMDTLVFAARSASLQNPIQCVSDGAEIRVCVCFKFPFNWPAILDLLL